MTSGNSVLHGATLEECHTNIFALTDLTGIKFKRYAHSLQNLVKISDDPLLTSYSQLIDRDVLCAWKKSPDFQCNQSVDDFGHPTPGRPHHMDGCNKELYIFYYGDEPKNLPLSSELREVESGSWDHGLSYECRTLLFKAIHNFLERYLLSEKYFRLGKWFFKPFDEEESEKSFVESSRSHLSFRFSFFLHGDATVCAAVNVRKHCRIQRVTRARLDAAVISNIPVVLCPYGISGELCGTVIKECDIEDTIEEWSKFYPLHSSFVASKQPIPKCVQVLIGGYKTLYPSCYVGISSQDLRSLDDFSEPMDESQILKATGILTPPTSPSNVSMIDAANEKINQLDQLTVDQKQNNREPSCLIQNTWLDSNVKPRKELSVSESSPTAYWDVPIPCSRACSCSFSAASVSKNPSSPTKIRRSFHSRHKRSFSMHGKESSPEVPSKEVIPVNIEPVKAKISSPTPGPICPSSTLHKMSFDHLNNYPFTEKLKRDLIAFSSPIHNFANSIADTKWRCYHLPRQRQNRLPELLGDSSSAPLRIDDRATYKKRRMELLLPTRPQPVLLTQQVIQPHGGGMLHPTPLDTAWRGSSPYGVMPSPTYSANVLPPPYLSSNDPYEFSDHQEPQAPMPGRGRGGRLGVKGGGRNRASKGKKTQDNKRRNPESFDFPPGTPEFPPSPLYSQYDVNPYTTIPHDPYATMYPPQSTSIGMMGPPPPYTTQQMYPHPGFRSPGPTPSFSPASEHLPMFMGDSPTSPYMMMPAGKTGIMLQPGPLLNSTDLQVTPNDLDHMFESSDDDPDPLMSTQVHQLGLPIMSHPIEFPPIVDNCNSQEPIQKLPDSDTDISASTTNASMMGNELSQMFPTPPSLESVHHQLSPMQTDVQPDTRSNEESPGSNNPYMYCDNPVSSPEVFSDWSFVFRLPDLQVVTGPAVYMCLQQLSESKSLISYQPSFVDPQPVQHGNVNGERSLDSTVIPPVCIKQEPSCIDVPNAEILPKVSDMSSVLFAVLLSDSIMNVFRDVHFDSCTICVCNNDIKGIDFGCYLVHANQSHLGTNVCTCGFSAVSNRYISECSGLFEDDLQEILYPHLPPIAKPNSSSTMHGEKPTKCGNSGSNDLLKLLLAQCTIPFGEQPWSMYLEVAPKHLNQTLYLKDHYLTTVLNLKISKFISDSNVVQKIPPELSSLHGDYKTKDSTVAERKGMPPTDYDRLLILLDLQVMLQDAMTKKRLNRQWEASHSVQGPLTWSQFLQIKSSSVVGTCQPASVPSLLVGHEKEWLSVSPYVLQYWDRLLLEPYSHKRNICYVAVIPATDSVEAHSKSYFSELGRVYESCKLGEHRPLNRDLVRQGIVRITPKTEQMLQDLPVHEWFNTLGPGKQFTRLKLYAQVVRHVVCQQLLDEIKERKAAELENKGEINIAEVQSERFPTIKHHTNDISPSFVIYLVNPFFHDAQIDDSLSSVALLRCFQMLMDGLREVGKSNNFVLKVIPLVDVMQSVVWERVEHAEHTKNMAFSVFSQCRKDLSSQLPDRTLTGFGTAATLNVGRKRLEELLPSFKLYSPPYILAPDNSTIEGVIDQSISVLFCSYCLSHDRKWLVVTCTDIYGEILEATLINVENSPTATQKRRSLTRKVGLLKIWEFCVGLIAITKLPWHIVIGRLGRMGHGEMMDWSTILSRTRLTNVTQSRRESCISCDIQEDYNFCVLSVCLTSMEPCPNIKLILDNIGGDRGRLSNQPKKDVSVTHVLVFPTSATTQSANLSSLSIDPFSSTGADDMFGGATDDFRDEYLFDIDQDISQILGDNDNVFDNIGDESLFQSNVPDQQPQLGGAVLDHKLPIYDNSIEQPVLLLQQPLALGYLISTATLPHLPSWFWAGCEDDVISNDPVVLKLSLHIHTTVTNQGNEDPFSTSNIPKTHALDSHVTTDVIRYVLQRYNSLSWLTMDPSTNDRRSCLPLHITVLSQLYHSIEKLL